MLVVVVAVFGVCWLPLHAFMLVVDTPGAAPDRRQNLHARRRLQPAADRLQDARTEAILHRHLLLRPLAGHVQQFRRRGRQRGVGGGGCTAPRPPCRAGPQRLDVTCPCGLDAKLLVSVSFRSRLGLGLGRNLSLIFSLGLSLSSVSRITALLRTCPPDWPRPRSPDPRALIINNALGSGWPCRTVSSTRSSTAFSTTASGQVVFIFKLLTCFVHQ